MTNAYCDLATLKSAGALNITGSVYDHRLLALLEEASRWIDGYCNRHFYVLSATRRFDGLGRQKLETPDLISVDTLRTWAGPGAPPVVWAEDDYRLYPLNSGPTQPWGRAYTRLLVNPNSLTQSYWPWGLATVEIAGQWGFRQVLAAAGTVIKAGFDLGEADTTLTVADGGKLSPGQTLAIDAEQLYVSAVNGDEATVKRGVNGAVAAGHRANSSISLYRYPGPVVEACLLLAAGLWANQNRPALPVSSVGNRSGSRSPGVHPGVNPEVESLLAAYRKLPLG